MKRLYLLRHAKSSWDAEGLPDHERPLAPRGHRAAKKIAAHLEREGIRPALVLCSPARRARETLEEVEWALGREATIEIEDGLYMASSDLLLERVRRIPRSVSSALVIGHNPSIHELAVELAGHGPGAPLAELRQKYPTGALAVLELPVEEWGKLEAGMGTLAAFVVPREL